MICPKCGAEYQSGFTQCSDCLIPLVENTDVAAREDPVASSGGPVKTVAVFRSGDPGRIALAKSILQSAGVPFVALNEAVQQWVGAGLVGGYNIVAGPVELCVPEADAVDARQMIADLEKGSAWIGDEDPGSGRGLGSGE